MKDDWQKLEREIIRCQRCPRLRAYCAEVARNKVRRFANDHYWGKPVPGFGDPEAWLWIMGLAPAAHGANRTGRMFTGDASGDFLFASLYRAGLASQPDSVHKNDGLFLRGVYVSAVARCAPPQNKLTPEEIRNCAHYLKEELGLLHNVQVVVALGRVAYQSALRLFREAGHKVDRVPFQHLAVAKVVYHKPVGSIEGGTGRSRPIEGRKGSLAIIASYHPSRQNTQTGRLTPAMLSSVWTLARHLANR